MQCVYGWFLNYNGQGSIVYTYTTMMYTGHPLDNEHYEIVVFIQHEQYAEYSWHSMLPGTEVGCNSQDRSNPLKYAIEDDWLWTA